MSSAESPRFGVVGLGRMAQALLFPLIESGQLAPADVRAAVGSAASAERLSQGHGLAVSTDPAEAWAAPVVLLAVKPQQLHQAATAAAGVAGAGGAAGQGLLISVLAGVTLERLQRLFPHRVCVRAVPNTPCLVRQGLTGLAWGGGSGGSTPQPTPQQRQLVQDLFERVGDVMELPESQLDAFLALTSSGPAFVALIAEAMADGAVAAGLPRVLAHHLAHRTLAGTAALLHEQELHPGQLKDMVSSPGGTTIAGLRELERAGARSALIEAVVAAAERSRALA
ncbi:pyrroline-5-carboxylate reductase [Synechococcus sp. CCY9202]|uniref:pyrroline-5-carboxylate reductase n=2 Tax=Synechococcus TaxID=1129 RepID=UPI002B21ECE8|nr:pyrroline-5-carboxylate reductase [Synechococcus sp. CCY9202]MEA5424547.1 pyrroline-5-carboxylate reductase [Synechococcus sp. CCY9202]